MDFPDRLLFISSCRIDSSLCAFSSCVNLTSLCALGHRLVQTCLLLLCPQSPLCGPFFFFFHTLILGSSALSVPHMFADRLLANTRFTVRFINGPICATCLAMPQMAFSHSVCRGSRCFCVCEAALRGRLFSLPGARQTGSGSARTAMPLRDGRGKACDTAACATAS